MSKKGDVTLMKVLGGLIISIIILVILFKTGDTLLGLMTGQDSSEEYFKFLIINIGKLEDKPIDKPIEIVYSINEDDFLVGFPSNTAIIEGINKPIAENKCSEGKTCFCLCKNKDDKNACYRSGSICEAETVEKYKEINGFILDKNGNEDKNLQGLLIEGRNKFPLGITKDGNKLSFEKVNKQ